MSAAPPGHPGGPPAEPTRRSLLAAIAGGTAAVGALANAAAWAAALAPRVRYEPSTIQRLGAPGHYPEGFTFLRDEHLFVLREEDKFRAISAVCTHLGCTVDRSAEGFRCPCHGSAFDAKGNVQGGPAPRGLPWLPLTLAGDSSLVVDLAGEVTADVALVVKEAK